VGARAPIGSDFAGAPVRLPAPGADFWIKLGNKIWIRVFIDLVRDAKELSDKLAEASPEMRVCLHAECYANRQHQETCFEFVHSRRLLSQLVCHAFLMSYMLLDTS
jgi:hypothetical protein